MQKFLINYNKTLHKALEQLNQLKPDPAILIVVDEDGILKGSVTDGDIRRALLNGKDLNCSINEVIQPNPAYVNFNDIKIISKLKSFREKNFKIIPIIDEKTNRVLDVINFFNIKNLLPVDVVIMAGGKGTRLRPLTYETPKPLVTIGNKPIIDYTIDELVKYGVDCFWVTINYMADEIERYLSGKNQNNASIQTIREDDEMGTAGSLTLIGDYKNNYILLTNSDLLTNLDYEAFFIDFIEKDADISILSIPYDVAVPYAVLKTDNGQVKSFAEKPTYSYHCNGGIYLFKKEMIDMIPKSSFFNATDLIEKAIDLNKKVITFNCEQYWLDIGKPNDLEKAKQDVKTFF